VTISRSASTDRRPPLTANTRHKRGMVRGILRR
jgi:hypothetical protein